MPTLPIAVAAVDITYRDVEVHPDGRVEEVGEQKPFRVEKSEQIANFADYCNHCGNCDTFCPEYDGPYLMKPSFFGSRAAFEAGAPHDGFYLAGSSGELRLTARIAEKIYTLSESNGDYHYIDGTITLAVSPEGAAKLIDGESIPAKPHRRHGPLPRARHITTWHHQRRSHARSEYASRGRSLRNSVRQQVLTGIAGGEIDPTDVGPVVFVAHRHKLARAIRAKIFGDFRTFPVKLDESRLDGVLDFGSQIVDIPKRRGRELLGCRK